MKFFLFFLILVQTVFAGKVIAQADFPAFLEGTWKMENGEIYEKWELLENQSLEGISYRLENGEEATTEYLKIRREGEQVIYTATVPAQNEGREIEFILHRPDSLSYSFENPEHDFPKKILYQKKSDSEIFVAVSDGGEQGFAYTMKKIAVEEPNILRSFFGDISGVWVASPADSSFISTLEYKKGHGQFLIPVGNTLTSKTGELFAEYEGVYVYNPVDEHITFTTVTKNEIHTGMCEVKGDTLFHRAQISGPGNIKSYSSAIVKMNGKSLHYFASYSDSETIPELQFREPLIYRKQQTN